MKSLYLTIFIAALLVSESTARGQERPENRYWKAIGQLAVTHSKAPLETTAEHELHWIETGITCQNTFADMMKEESRMVLLSDFTRRFGKEGPAKDICWMLAVTPYLTGNRGAAIFTDEWRQRAIYVDGIPFNKCLVARILEEPEIGSRLWHAVVYGRAILGTDEVPLRHAIQFGLLRGATKKGFALKDEARKPWFHLNFIYLAIATGRDDLLKDAKPADLAARFEVWEKWLEENRDYLRPDTTFPRWVIDDNAVKMGVRVTVDGKLAPIKIPNAPFDDIQSDFPSPKVFSQTY